MLNKKNSLKFWPKKNLEGTTSKTSISANNVKEKPILYSSKHNNKVAANDEDDTVVKRKVMTRKYDQAK